jgi:hypothetical protein
VRLGARDWRPGYEVPAHAREGYLWGRLSSLPGRRIPPTRMGDILIRESIGIAGEINIAGDMQETQAQGRHRIK